MSTVVRLPEELRVFLDLPEPQTLVIRGPPGSGKTTLGLTLLETFHGDKFLVTSRVPGNEISREFSWLRQNGGRSIQVIDTSAASETVRESAEQIVKTRETLIHTDKAEALDITSFLWLPTPLQEAWSRLNEHHRSLIVIDSWEALIERYLSYGPRASPTPDRAEIERILLRRMSPASAHLVFILERDEPTALDYLVDGLVQARRETVDERLQRWLTILKLRGVPVENPIYPFTLEGGRFECISPARPYALLRPGRPDPEPDRMPGHLWPGAKGFAESFGRMPFGALTLIEMDDATPFQVMDVLTLPAIAHVLSVGGRVLEVPNSSESPSEALGYLKDVVPADRVLNHLKLLVPAGATSKLDPQFLMPVERLEFVTGGGDGPRDPVPKFLREGLSESTPSLLVISVQGLETMAATLGQTITPESERRLPGVLMGMIRGGALHAIVVCRRQSAFLNPLRAIASIRVDLNIRQGRIFIHGVSPWTTNFVLTEGSERGPFQLLRVV